MVPTTKTHAHVVDFMKHTHVHMVDYMRKESHYFMQFSLPCLVDLQDPRWDTHEISSFHDCHKRKRSAKVHMRWTSTRWKPHLWQMLKLFWKILTCNLYGILQSNCTSKNGIQIK